MNAKVDHLTTLLIIIKKIRFIKILGLHDRIIGLTIITLSFVNIRNNLVAFLILSIFEILWAVKDICGPKAQFFYWVPRGVPLL